MRLLGLLSRFSSLAIRVYYRLEVTGNEVPTRGPVLLVANHPNALMDAACVFAAAARPVRFLAKSPLLRMPVLGWILRSSGAIPVYRSQDDPRQIRKNVEVLKSAHRALGEGWAVGIFPEGRSHGDPAISPLRTGAARIALGAASEVASTSPGASAEIFPIIPLGLSFAQKERFRSAALVVVGEEIRWSDLGGSTARDKDAVRELTRRIDEGLRGVTLNLERWEDAPLVACAEAVHRAETESGPTLAESAERLERRRLVAEALHDLRQNDPERLEVLLPSVARFHRALRVLGLTAEDLDEDPRVMPILRRRIASLALFFASVPLLIAGFAVFAVPYLCTDLLSRLRKWTPEDRSTVKILGGIVLYGTWVILLAAAVGLRLGVLAGLAAVPALWALARSTQWLRDWWQDVSREVRLVVLLGSRGTLRKRLLRRRRDLAREIEAVRQDLLTRGNDSTRIPSGSGG